MVYGVGVPIKLLHEAQGLIVTIELKTGQVYRGKLFEAEDSMNVQLREVLMTARDGQVIPMESVFLRGSAIRFFIVPDNLRHAPLLSVKKVTSGATAAISSKPSTIGMAGKTRGGITRGRAKIVRGRR